MTRLLLLAIVTMLGVMPLGCSAMMSCIGAPRHGPPHSPYSYADRAAFEEEKEGWGAPVEQVTCDGFVYQEYRHYVHAPRDHVDAMAYAYYDVMTLGLSEVVTVPMELVRIVGFTDYFERVRVEWDERGRLVAWMWHWREGESPDHPQGWGKRETELPRYYWRQAVPGAQDGCEGR